MHKNRENYGNTSTPKRRRLGTAGRTLRQSLDVFHKKYSPVHPQITNSRHTIIERCESPPIPCNQYEYLCDSSNNTSSSLNNNIPQSPSVFEGSLDCGEFSYLPSQIDKPNSLNDSADKENKDCNDARQVMSEIEEVSNDMFQSRMEAPETFDRNCGGELLTSRCEKYFKQSVQESFELVNQSICGLDKLPKNDLSELFETKDSFLLDIKDTCALVEESESNRRNQSNNLQYNNVSEAKVESNNVNNFYGLPLNTKQLFKTYRNIEKFYDWQEECLNLEAVKIRQNLIYALPTSGGKTLVAEVLMLREVLNRKKNALFILPFVAIVQEKIWSLSPFAVQLEFLVEEYAGGKGHIPPKKRRKRHSIYIATIEKGLALVRSLIGLDRLDEIGLIVVDELHLIGEAGRGSTLETLLTTVIFANKGIQIVGMSATIGNLPEVAQFLQAAVFERHFRPVELAEYVKLGDMLYKLTWGEGGVEIVPEREIKFDYSEAAQALDPDWLGGLVSEVTPADSCLVFCPTKSNCENVASLLCKMQRREMTEHRVPERLALQVALRQEGVATQLERQVRYGVAYHHAGIASDERTLIEHAFRSGVISVLCCTSTLAAGVNLPARRVIIRSPRVARHQLTLAGYRQMAGRAGRAGHCPKGESIIICSPAEWPQLRSVLGGGVSAACSGLARCTAMDELLLSAVALNVACTRASLQRLVTATLLAVQAERLQVDVKQLCDASIRSLLQSGAIEVAQPKTKPQTPSGEDCQLTDQRLVVEGRKGERTCYVYDDSVLAVSTLGNAAIAGCLDLATTRVLLKDLEQASRGLVLNGSAHLLYLVTSHDPASAGVRPDYARYYHIYSNLNEECLQTARALGITEKSAIRMITGKPITNVSETVLSRFYIALILYDLWNEVPLSVVVEKYGVSRGVVQQLLTAACARAACAGRAAAAQPRRWALHALLAALPERLQHAGQPQLRDLCQLPSVRRTRALQLWKAGYKTVESLARASSRELADAVSHLTTRNAEHLISAARLMLIEKVENLRAEAEDVMEELNM